jgi:hypothetical protein
MNDEMLTFVDILYIIAFAVISYLVVLAIML